MSLLVNPPHEWGHFERSGEMVRPSVNVIDHGDKLVIEVMAPGMSFQDFGISIENNRLWIEGYHKDRNRKSKNYLQQEFPHDSIQFRRYFELDENVETENYQTSYQSGILKIVFDKKREEVWPHPVMNAN